MTTQQDAERIRRFINKQDEVMEMIFQMSMVDHNLSQIATNIARSKDPRATVESIQVSRRSAKRGRADLKSTAHKANQLFNYISKGE